METLQRDYAHRGVEFIYIYKALAHPRYNGYVAPVTMKERLMHLREAERTLGSAFTWVADGMDHAASKALGGVPNSEFLVGPDGRVIQARAWSVPEALRADLVAIFGAVAQPTRVEDLNLAIAGPPALAATGVVPRLETPRRKMPLRLLPEVDDEDTAFYVKVRAMADHDLAMAGRGRLYVSLFLDPLYRVHWNNESPAPRLRFSNLGSTVVAPDVVTGPKVAVKADADPRDFVVDVDASKGSGSLSLVLNYVACDDANTFCVPVEQRYTLLFEGDRNAGWPIDRRPGTVSDHLSKLMYFDVEGDRKLARAEVPESMQDQFEAIDVDSDGYIDDAEIELEVQRVRALHRRWKQNSAIAP